MKKLFIALAIIFCMVGIGHADTSVEGSWWSFKTDCSGVVGEGTGCWDTDNDNLYIGTGTAAQAIGGVSPSYSSVTVTGLTSSKPVFTDGSKVLTSTGTVPVDQGGTGRATGTAAYGLIAAGTTATGAQQTLGVGTLNYTLIGKGSSALPVWTDPNKVLVSTAADLKLYGQTSPVNNIYITGSFTTAEALTFPVGTVVHYTCGSKVTLAHNIIHTDPPVFDGICQAFVPGAGTVTGLKEPRPEYFTTNTVPGTTDMTTAFNAAATSITTGNIVATGTYSITSDITLPMNVGIDGKGSGVIDGSNATISAYSLIYNSGSISASLGGGIASNVTAGDTTITMSSDVSGNLVGGDLIVITDSGTHWNESYHKGEYLVVKSVSTVTITLTSRVIDSYTTATPSTVHKVTPTMANFKDFTLIGNTASTQLVSGLEIIWGRDNSISGVRFKNLTRHGIELRAFNAAVSNVEMGKYHVDSGSVQSAAIVIAGQYNHVRDSYLYAARHGVSTGGGFGEPGTAYGIDRFNVVENCFIGSTENYAADMHGGGEYNTDKKNTISGGVNLSGSNNSIIDNVLNDGFSTVTLIHLENMKSFNHTVSGNTLNPFASATVVDGTGATVGDTNTNVAGTFKFHNNVITDKSAADKTYLRFRINDSAVENRLSIKDNVIEKTNTSYYGKFLDTNIYTPTNTSVFTSIDASDNKFINTNFGAIAFTGGGAGTTSYTGTNNIGMGCSSSASCTVYATNIEINGSTYSGPNAPEFIGRMKPSSFTFTRVFNLTTPAKTFYSLSADSASGQVIFPQMVTIRLDTDVTATDGDYWSVGSDAANQYAEYGANAAAAASSKHAKNEKITWFATPDHATSTHIVGGKYLTINSVNATTDAAALANNMGGAGQTATMTAKVLMFSTIADAP